MGSGVLMPVQEQPGLQASPHSASQKHLSLVSTESWASWKGWAENLT